MSAQGSKSLEDEVPDTLITPLDVTCPRCQRGRGECCRDDYEKDRPFGVFCPARVAKANSRTLRHVEGFDQEE